MFTLTIAQMRRSIGRLTAAGIAIVIGTAFVAATLLAGDVIKRSSFDSVTASYGDAALVVLAEESEFPDSLTLDDVERLRAVDGVAALDGQAGSSTTLANGIRQVIIGTIATGSSPSLQPLVASSGRLPAASGEIALPPKTADRLGVGLGDTVRQDRLVHDKDHVGQDDADEPAWVSETVDMTVVGLVDDPNGAFAMFGGAAVLVEQDLYLELDDGTGSGPLFNGAAALLEPGADVGTVRADLAAAAPSGYVVWTKDEVAASSIASVTSGADMFTAAVLAFAAIAMLVAALVIANTFQVLVAQRTRTLALLRCVGATKAQLRRSVLLEAGILGVVASLVGIVLGSVLVQVAVMVLGRMNLEIPLQDSITPTMASVLVPLAVGTLVTVLASLVPARAATAVAPLAALRPTDVPTTTARSGKVRVAASILLVVTGLGIAVTSMLFTDQLLELALAGGVLGGAISLVGILLAAVYWVPVVLRLAERSLGRGGASAQLAAANTTRNPRRTAATSTALLIGVTLVAMMSVAAATTRASLNGTLDDTYPVDLTVDGTEYTPDGELSSVLTPALLTTLGSVPGVEQVAARRSATVSITQDGRTITEETAVRGVDPDEATAAVRNPGWVAALDDGTLVMSAAYAAEYGVDDGSTVEITGPDGTASVRLDVSEDGPRWFLLMTPATLAELDADAPVTDAWVRLADTDDPMTTVDAVREAFSEEAVSIAGAAIERQGMQDVIDMVLAVVIGLLAIAVVIALIGVANTLSLSVLERRRESATLRAIGLSRRQLRSTLAIEGMLIAGVGAVVGVVLGLGYGWMGSVVALGSFAEIHLTVPWSDLAVLVLVALAAGLLASVLPARSAARTSPVEALAID